MMRIHNTAAIKGKTDAAFPFQSYDSYIAMNPGYARIRIWIRIQ